MLLLNYTVPENYIPPELYEYTDNERYLLLLFGNAVIQTIKKSVSLTDADNDNPIVNELVNKYAFLLKEKDNIINNLELSNKLTIEIYKDMIETETSKLNGEIQKKLLKERQHFDETVQLMKEHYENTISFLKIEKEKAVYFERENAVLDEKIKNCNTTLTIEKKLVYNETYNTLQREKEALKEENFSLKTEIQNLLNEKEREKYEKTETAIVELQNKIEEIKQQTSKKAVSQNIGQEGEAYFFELVSEVFNEIDGFEIEDTTKKGHMGDFLLKFKEFSVIVDVKNFNNSKVSITDIRKLKADAKSNQHIRFVWMVSLNKSISTHDKHALDFEYENGVLFCYINSLFQWEENRKNILIACWLFCKEVYLNFFDKENESSEKIIALLKQDSNKKLVAERGRKRIKELRAVMEQMKTTVYELEKDFIEIITGGDILTVYEDNLISLKNWWIQTLTREEEKKNRLEIDAVFEKYKSSVNNPSPEMDVDNFILGLKTFIKEEDFTKNKAKGAKKYVLNYKWVM